MEFRDIKTRFSIKELERSYRFLSDFKEECKKFREFCKKRKFQCINKYRYLQEGFDEKSLELVKITKNKHQPGENLRAYCEIKNTCYFKYNYDKGIYEKDVIDVGPSVRLNINGIARLLIAPVKELNDYVRHIKLDENKSVILGIDFQHFVQDYEDMLQRWDVIYNFTDTLYYLDLKVTHFIYDGIVGCGTMHIYKYDGDLKFDKKFGCIKKDGDNITMMVDGNMSVYKHVSKYEELIKNDCLLIHEYQDKKLYIKKEAHFDCGATAYISFTVIKTALVQVPKKIDLEVDDNVDDEYIGDPEFESRIMLVNSKLTRVNVNQQLIDKVRIIYNQRRMNNKITLGDLIRKMEYETLGLKMQHMKLLAKWIIEENDELDKNDE